MAFSDSVDRAQSIQHYLELIVNLEMSLPLIKCSCSFFNVLQNAIRTP